MSTSLSNPARLLIALDERLDHEVPLVLYGRASLDLGFDGSGVFFEATKDVDVIIPLIRLDEIVNDESFWDARDAVNAAFEGEGL